MGGASFVTGPNALFTPRMPPQVYHETKARLHRALRDLYLCVASPIDGPGKSDFGDIDILVTWNRAVTLGLGDPPSNVPTPRGTKPGAKGSTNDPELTAISRALGASHMLRENGTKAAHYAVPWPTHLSHLGPEPDRERHIQVDVRVCPSLQDFQWGLFKHAHGDLWNILGSTVRPLGLTVDEEALWIRVPEIEGVNRRRSKVWVTDDPGRVLEVLGLRGGTAWEEPFGSREELYEYAARSPLFWVKPLEEGESEGKKDGSRVDDDKRALKSNDRRRMNTRPCYRGWVEDFLPRCRAEGRFAERRHTRESVTERVFGRFPVELEFRARLREFEIEQQRNDIWKNRIKGFVEGLEGLCSREGLGMAANIERERTYRGCLTKALKRIVLEEDAGYGILPRKRLRDDDGRYLMDNVVEFIQGEYKAVGDAAMRAHDEEYSEMMRARETEEMEGVEEVEEARGEVMAG